MERRASRPSGRAQAFGANRRVMSDRGLNLAPPGATIEAELTSYLLSAKELNADSQFHHRLCARARHSAVRRPATRLHAPGSLLARGGLDRSPERGASAFHGIQTSHHRSPPPHSPASAPSQTSSH